MKILFSIVAIFFLQTISYASNIDTTAIVGDSTVIVLEVENGDYYTNINNSDIYGTSIKVKEKDGKGAFILCAVVSAVGTYSLYGIGVGPVVFAVVMLCNRHNRKVIRRALWGTITGMTLGGAVRIITLN